MNIIDLILFGPGVIVETITEADINRQLEELEAERAVQVAFEMARTPSLADPLVIKRAGESFVDLRVLAQIVNAPAIQEISFEPYVINEYGVREYECLSREGDAYISSLAPFPRGANGRPVRA